MTAASKIRPLGGSRNLCNLFVQLEFKDWEGEEGGVRGKRGREEERDRDRNREKRLRQKKGKREGSKRTPTMISGVGKGHRSGV